MTISSGALIRCTGLLAGCLLGIALIAAGRIPEGRAASGVELALRAGPATTLGVSPAGTDFLKTRSFEPGGPAAQGSLTVSNYTGHDLIAGLRLSGADRDLDSLVQVAVSAEGETLFTGPLGELRESGRLELDLAPRGSSVLAFRAWLPRSVRRDFQGRSARLRLNLKPSRTR